MQIHLKQREIEAALKMFVSQQGINLTHKQVTLAFTAGRKDTGLSVELSIEDAATDSTNTFVDSAFLPASEPAVEEPPAKTTSLFS